MLCSARAHFHAKHTSKGLKAAQLLAEACQIVHSLGLHNDVFSRSTSHNFIDVQQSRRIFWHLYAIDM